MSPPGEVKSHAMGEEGSASLELVGTLPFLLLAILVAAQLAVAGASLWSAALAARAGSRAALVGGRAEEAARAALPAPLRRGAGVAAAASGVRVEVPLPPLLPGMPPAGIHAKTGLGPGG